MVNSFVRALIGCVLALTLTGAGPDSFSRADLDRLEKNKARYEAEAKALRQNARDAERALSRLTDRSIAIAQESRRQEQRAAETETRLATLEAEAEQKQAALTRDRAALEDLMAALMILSSRQPPALAVHPDNAGDAARAALLMAEITPELTARADAFARDLEALNALRVEVETERASLSASQEDLYLRRLEIDALTAEQRKVWREFDQHAAQLEARSKRLSEEARDLEDLLERLEATAPPTPRLKPAPPSRTPAVRPSPRPGASPAPQVAARPSGVPDTGRGLPAPVEGRIVRSFGSPQPSGGRAQGRTYSTRPGALVTSPVDGKVEFSGPLRGYGDVLIINAGGGNLVVLAGMASISVVDGQALKAGEPIGRMADSQTSSPELSVELWRSRRPIDPALWVRQGA